MLSIARVCCVLVVLGVAATTAHAQLAETFAGDKPTRRAARPAALLGPLDIAANDGFDGLTFEPALEGAYTLRPGRANIFLRGNVSRTIVGDVTDAYRFEGTTRELRVQAAVGLADFGAPLELRVGLSLAALSGSERHVQAPFAGAPVIANGWEKGGGARRAWLGLKMEIFEASEIDFLAAVSGWVKLPIDGDHHLTDTGEIEAGAMLHLTYAMRVPDIDDPRANIYLHLTAGGMWRREQTVFRNSRARPQAGALYGASLVVRPAGWPAVAVLQVRGNVNSWQSLGGFSSDPISVQIGGRGWFAEGLVYEVGISSGLSDSSSADWALELSAGYRF